MTEEKKEGKEKRCREEACKSEEDYVKESSAGEACEEDIIPEGEKEEVASKRYNKRQIEIGQILTDWQSRVFNLFCSQV